MKRPCSGAAGTGGSAPLGPGPNGGWRGEVGPLLAQRGFAVPGQPGLRLRTLADVVAYANVCGVELRLDGSETQIRRPAPTDQALQRYLGRREHFGETYLAVAGLISDRAARR